MAMGTTVFRIRIELIFRRCGNLVTPSRSCRGLCALMSDRAGAGLHEQSVPKTVYSEHLLLERPNSAIAMFLSSRFRRVFGTGAREGVAVVAVRTCDSQAYASHT